MITRAINEITRSSIMKMTKDYYLKEKHFPIYTANLLRRKGKHLQKEK